MPNITISTEVHAQVAQFKQLVDAVVDEEVSLDLCLELIIKQGIDSMVADLLQSSDRPTLLRALQQLGSLYPEQVYRYITETMRKGGQLLEQQEKMKRQLGFATGPKEPNNIDQT